MEYFKKLIREYRKRKYYKKRAKIWEDFKKTHTNMECSLLKNPRWSHEIDCHNCSYDEDFFRKYGCMYIKDFMEDK